MPVPVNCNFCDATYQVREDKLGKRIRCQKCGETFTLVEATSPATSAADEVQQIRIDVTPNPVPVKAKEKSTLSGFWKIVGVIAGLFVLSLLTGLVYSPAGMILMMGWSFAGLGLTLFGVFRFFQAMEGHQRFWMMLKILLCFVGWKLFYVDASLYNKKTARAFAWMGIGFVLLFASFLPASIFLNKTREVVQNDVDESKRKMEQHSSNVDPLKISAQPSSPFRQPVRGGNIVPPQLPPGGYGFVGAPPGFRPPPNMNPGVLPGGFPAGAMPIRFLYESFDYPQSEIPERIDQRFKSFKFYVPGTVHIYEPKKSIEFTAKYPPDRNETLQIRDAYTEVGVNLKPRR